MRKLLSISVLLSLTLIFNSCKPDEEPTGTPTGTVNFKVSLSDGQNAVQPGDVIALNNNQDIRILDFRMYISEISFVPHSTNSSSEEVEVSDVEFIDFGEDGDNTFSSSVNTGRYGKIKLSLGLNAAMNDLNPVDFPEDHPLYLARGMYWNMLKYRFASFTGKANTTGNLGDTSDISIVYHTGTDVSYQQLELDFDINLDPNSSEDVELIIDLNELFAGSNPFDFINGNEAQSHSSPSQIHISQKFMENLKESISLSAD